MSSKLCVVCASPVEGKHKYCTNRCRWQAWAKRKYTTMSSHVAVSTEIQPGAITMSEFVDIWNDLIRDGVQSAMDVLAVLPLIFNMLDRQDRVTHTVQWDNTAGKIVIYDLVYPD